MLCSVTAIVVILLLLVLSWFIKCYKYNKYLKKFPIARPIPIIGNAWDFKTTTESLASLLRYQQTYGENYRLILGFRTILVVTGYELTEFLLSSSKIITRTVEYRNLFVWLGTGLLTSSGQKWKKFRKLTTPAFHFQILEQFVEIFDKTSRKLVEKLESEVGKDSTNVLNYLSLCSFDMICETTMGTNMNTQDNSNSEYVRSVKEMCRILMQRTISPLKIHDCFFKFSKDFEKQQKALQILHGYSNSVIKNRKRQLEEKGSGDSGISRKRRLALLDLLLQYNADGQPISDEEIREQVDTFMFEGHDTTAAVTSFLLLCLAHNRDVQEKVVEEIGTIFEDDINRPITLDDLHKMTYLEMVIKETARLYPAAPFFARELDEDVEFDGTTFPKGLSFFIFAFGIGRNPKVFPEPEKFDPERFSLENSTGRRPYSYVPFSAGPRNCIGQKYAKLEMKAIVTNILKSYELYPTEPMHKPILATEGVLTSANGICMRFQRRQL